MTDSLQILILNELSIRQKQVELSYIQRKAHQQQVEQLIQDHCEISSEDFIKREEWQDFCFRQIFKKTCHTNIPFSTYLNNLMPQLGFPLGWAHTKLSVYRGLKWKTQNKK